MDLCGMIAKNLHLQKNPPLTNTKTYETVCKIYEYTKGQILKFKDLLFFCFKSF